MKGTFF